VIAVTPGPAARLLAIMRQAETVDDLREFAAAPRAQAIVAELAARERELLAQEYETLRLGLRGRVKFDALAGRRVIVTTAGRPYYSDKQGADVVDFGGIFGDTGRPFRTTSAAPNVVRYFRRLAQLPSPERALVARFCRVNSATNPYLWKVREIVSSDEPDDANPFEEESPDASE
jgi:hypothetical protein